MLGFGMRRGWRGGRGRGRRGSGSGFCAGGRRWGMLRIGSEIFFLIFVEFLFVFFWVGGGGWGGKRVHVDCVVWGGFIFLLGVSCIECFDKESMDCSCFPVFDFLTTVIFGDNCKVESLVLVKVIALIHSFAYLSR